MLRHRERRGGALPALRTTVSLLNQGAEGEIHLCGLPGVPRLDELGARWLSSTPRWG